MNIKSNRLISPAFLSAAIAVLVLAQAPAWSGGHENKSEDGPHGAEHHSKHDGEGHGKHKGKHKGKRGAHFMAPGVMKTTLKHASGKQRGVIRKNVKKFRSAKKEMGKLMRAGKPNEAKIKKTRAKIDEASDALRAVVKEVAQKEEAAEALKQLRKLTMLSRHFMHHEDHLREFAGLMADDGDDFVEDILKNRAKIHEHKDKIKGYKAGVDYSKIDKARIAIRELKEAQQKLVREALDDNPKLRDDWIAKVKEMHKKHKGKHKGEDGGECEGGD